MDEIGRMMNPRYVMTKLRSFVTPVLSAGLPAAAVIVGLSQLATKKTEHYTAERWKLPGASDHIFAYQDEVVQPLLLLGTAVRTPRALEAFAILIQAVDGLVTALHGLLSTRRQAVHDRALDIMCQHQHYLARCVDYFVRETQMPTTAIEEMPTAEEIAEAASTPETTTSEEQQDVRDKMLADAMEVQNLRLHVALGTSVPLDHEWRGAILDIMEFADSSCANALSAATIGDDAAEDGGDMRWLGMSHETAARVQREHETMMRTFAATLDTGRKRREQRREKRREQREKRHSSRRRSSGRRSSGRRSSGRRSSRRHSSASTHSPPKQSFDAMVEGS